MGPNSIAIIATREEMYRNRDADYKFRADSSFSIWRALLSLKQLQLLKPLRM